MNDEITLIWKESDEEMRIASCWVTFFSWLNWWTKQGLIWASIHLPFNLLWRDERIEVRREKKRSSFTRLPLLYLLSFYLSFIRSLLFLSFTLSSSCFIFRNGISSVSNRSIIYFFHHLLICIILINEGMGLVWKKREKKERGREKKERGREKKRERGRERKKWEREKKMREKGWKW